MGRSEKGQAGEPEDKPLRQAPRWAFLIAVLLIGFMLSILSNNLTFGPRWTVLVLTILLLVPMVIAIFRGHHHWTQFFAIAVTTVVTLGMASSVIFLLHALFTHAASAASLFRDAGVLWIANIIVFAAWYWELDRGGPAKRHSKVPDAPDFLFPQMMTDGSHYEHWIPSFIDYVYLAFNTNTAFSPTDTMVLTRRAKLLMMTQSSISLLIVGVLAARAVNIA